MPEQSQTSWKSEVEQLVKKKSELQSRQVFVLQIMQQNINRADAEFSNLANEMNSASRNMPLIPRQDSERFSGNVRSIQSNLRATSSVISEFGSLDKEIGTIEASIEQIHIKEIESLNEKLSLLMQSLAPRTDSNPSNDLTNYLLESARLKIEAEKTFDLTKDIAEATKVLANSVRLIDPLSPDAIAAEEAAQKTDMACDEAEKQLKQVTVLTISITAKVTELLKLNGKSNTAEINTESADSQETLASAKRTTQKPEALGEATEIDTVKATIREALDAAKEAVKKANAARVEAETAKEMAARSLSAAEKGYDNWKDVSQKFKLTQESGGESVPKAGEGSPLSENIVHSSTEGAIDNWDVIQRMFAVPTPNLTVPGDVHVSSFPSGGSFIKTESLAREIESGHSIEQPQPLEVL